MTQTLSDRFTSTFREEHRVIRDLLLDLIDAIEQRDAGSAAALLGTIAARTGPHFRYEEEALYPALIATFGPEYVSKLLEDHDAAIRAAARLVEIVGSGELDDRAGSEAVDLVRGILPHVSDCDGLSIYVERFSEPDVDAIFEARHGALAEALPLQEWATSVRDRAL